MKSTYKKTFNDQRQKFIDSVVNQLFHICCCNCENINECSCQRERKVPQIEREFLIDQNTIRDMYFSGEDSNLTRKFERKQMKKKLNQNAKKPDVELKVKSRESRYMKRKNISAHENSISPKRLKMEHVAPLLDRLGVSDRHGASLVNSTFKDVKNITNEMDVELSFHPVDRNAIRRARAKSRKRIVHSHLDNLHKFVDESAHFGLFFDGKQDKTNSIILNAETGNRPPRIVNEDHCAILFEPGNQFYTHVTPEGKTAADISKSIIDKLKEDKFNLEKIKFVGCDGTPTNTGHNKGVIQRIEKEK